jgi:hypothetical protein
MNLGIMLPDLSASQLAFEVINQANKLSFEGKYECILFPLGIGTICVKPNVAILNPAEVYDFKGVLIATNLHSASVLCNLKNNARKLFYIWDLEYLRGKVDYVSNIQTYANPKIELICRSEFHAQMIENYCNRKPRIVKNCNIKEMVENEIH